MNFPRAASSRVREPLIWVPERSQAPAGLGEVLTLHRGRSLPGPASRGGGTKGGPPSRLHPLRGSRAHCARGLDRPQRAGRFSLEVAKSLKLRRTQTVTVGVRQRLRSLPEGPALARNQAKESAPCFPLRHFPLAGVPTPGPERPRSEWDPPGPGRHKCQLVPGRNWAPSAQPAPSREALLPTLLSGFARRGPTLSGALGRPHSLLGPKHLSFCLGGALSSLFFRDAKGMAGLGHLAPARGTPASRPCPRLSISATQEGVWTSGAPCPTCGPRSR